MIKPKRMVTAGATLAIALGIGYIMQSSAHTPAPAPAQQAKAKAETPAVSAQGMVGSAAKPAKDDTEVGDVTLTAVPKMPVAPEKADLPAEPVTNAALKDDVPAAVDLPKEEPAPELSCDYELTSRTEAAAMVRLSLKAPCMTNEKFTLHHNGMMFTQATDADGIAEFRVPALSANAVFIVAFANGEGAVANAEVSSLEYYDRAAVQWQGQSGLQMHALEFGATYGEPGHVWGDAARDESSAALGDGGFLTRLGDPELDNALLAEVYTFPTGTAKRDGDITLSVEAEITAANCGRDVEAQAIEKNPDGQLRTQDLVLAMPDCDAVGDFLVLKNLLNDLKIAAK